MNIVPAITLGWMKWEFNQHLLNEFYCNFCFSCAIHGASWVALVVKKPACKCRRNKRHRFDPWVGKIPWRRKCQPTRVLLLRESQDTFILVNCSVKIPNKS